MDSIYHTINPYFINGNDGICEIIPSNVHVLRYLDVWLGIKDANEGLGK